MWSLFYLNSHNRYIPNKQTAGTFHFFFYSKTEWKVQTVPLIRWISEKNIQNSRLMDLFINDNFGGDGTCGQRLLLEGKLWWSRGKFALLAVKKEQLEARWSENKCIYFVGPGRDVWRPSRRSPDGSDDAEVSLRFGSQGGSKGKMFVVLHRLFVFSISLCEDILCYLWVTQLWNPVWDFSKQYCFSENAESGLFACLGQNIQSQSRGGWDFGHE